MGTVGTRGLLTPILDRPAGEVVAAARVALASFTLLAVWLDPTQPDRYPAFTYSVLAAYVVQAIAMVLLSRRPSGQWLHVVAHIIDIAIIALLIYLTEGPTSPFFVLMTFVLLTAVLHWRVRGVLLTAVALVLLQLTVSFLDGIAEIDTFIMRSGYLVVGAALFAYYGVYREHLGERLKQLAAWLPDDVSTTDQPAFDSVLAQAAEVMHAPRVIVVYEGEQSPRLFVSIWSAGESTTETHPPDAFPDLVAPPLADAAFAVERGDDRVAMIMRGLERLGRAALDPRFVTRYSIAGGIVSAAFENVDARGRVLFVNPAPCGEEQLALVQIVANRVGNRISAHHIQLRLQQAMVNAERARLADDLHDSTLQVMTAASLQLKKMAEDEPAAGARELLGKIRSELQGQQKKIRTIVETLREGEVHGGVRLEEALHDTLAKIENVWHCRTKAEVFPASAAVPEHLQRQVELILFEAAANACRHGKASSLSVSARAQDRTLMLKICDDGVGLTVAEDDAQTDDPRPASIRRRVAALGGQVTLLSDTDGVDLRIRLPMP